MKNQRPNNNQAVLSQQYQPYTGDEEQYDNEDNQVYIDQDEEEEQYNQDPDKNYNSDGNIKSETYQQNQINRANNGEKMLLLNNSPGGQQMNINIQNNQAQYMNTIQNPGSSNMFNQYQQNPQQVIQMIQQKQQAKTMGQRNLRPQSAKPVNKFQMPHENSIYGTNFQMIKNQTLKNDYGGELNFARVNQIKSRLNSKLGLPYMQTIKAAHKQDFGIVQNVPAVNKQRPASGKIKVNRSLSRRQSDDHIYVNLNMNLDKEQLYQACLTLKQDLNRFMNENQQLKTQVQFLNTVLSFKLKQQLREIQQVMKAKDSEVELLKRNIRSTRLEEAEKTVQFFIQEGLRLRQQLEQSLQGAQLNQNINNQRHGQSQQLPEDPNKQMMIIQLQQQVNQQLNDIGVLSENLAAKDKEIQIWRQRCEKELKEKSKSGSSKDKLPVTKDEYNHMKQKLNDLQNVYEQTLLENQQISDQLEEIQHKNQNNAQSKEEELKNKIKELKKGIQEKDNEIKTLKSTIQNLEQKIVQHEQKIKEQSKNYENQIKDLKNQLEENIKDDVDNYDDDLKQQEYQAKLEDLQDQHQKEIKLLQEQQKQLQKQNQTDLDKQRVGLLESLKHEFDNQSLQLKSEQKKEINNIRQTYEQQLIDKQQQIQKLDEDLKLTKQQLLNMTNQYESNIQSRGGSIAVQHQSMSLHHQRQNSQHSSSHHSHSVANQSSAKYETKSVIKEDQIKQNFEHIKRKLQLERVSKDQVQQYLFEEQNQNREDISIKDFSSILFAKLLLDQTQANNLARFIIERPDEEASEIDYDPHKTLMNRKIVKYFHEKILGPQYQTYTNDQEKHVLKKYRELAQDHQEYYESTLSLYDFDQKGLITVNDLREALISQEIYDGRDKTSFECFSLYLLALNHKDTVHIRINDILDALYPNRDQPKVQKNKMSNSTVTNKSQQSQQQVQSQRSIVKMTTQTNNKQQIEKQKSMISNDEQIQEDVYDDQVQFDEAPPELNYLKSMDEDELLEKSERAFQLISQYLSNNNISLRNILKDKIYDQKIAIISEDQEENAGQESQRADKTFEVINTEDFFDSMIIEDLSESLKDSVRQIVAKLVPHQNRDIFIYKDLEEILGAYGFVDSIKPRNSRNLKYDLLDQKSIRIMNRLEQFLLDNNMQLAQLFEDKIYQKTINNSQIGTNQKKNFKLKFIKSREFFDRLKDLNIRKNGEPHKNLVEFLTIDSKTYKTGLVLKKIEKLLKECKENEYLRSIGINKRSIVEQQMAQINTPQGQSRLSQINQQIDEPIEEQYQEDYESVRDPTINDEEANESPIKAKESDDNDENLESLRTIPDVQTQQNHKNKPLEESKQSYSDVQHTILDHKFTQYGINEEPAGAIKFSGTSNHRSSVEIQKVYEEDIPEDQIINQYSESIEDNYSDHEF